MDSTVAFRLLASADRQHVLHSLLESDGEITVEELSREVAARRHRTPSSALPETDVERAQVRLVHIHFPKLTARNVVTVDWDDGSVHLEDEAAVDSLLAAAEELPDWPPDQRLKRPRS